MARQNLTEAGAFAAPIVEASKTGQLEIELINPGWGSSGHYSAEVLKAAAEAKVFPKGTHQYIDHPSESERTDRPERSVKDIAAVLTEDARWNGSALVANAKLVGIGKTLLADEDFAKAIGVSIRAEAEVELGEADGRKGWIVKEFFPDPFNSVDFVTHAGRGGRVLQLIESARRQMNETAKPKTEAVFEAVSRVAEATANDTREALQDALKEMYGAEKSWVWVRDFDESTVWFEHETPDICGVFAQAYSLSDTGVAALSGDRIEVRARTEYVPVAATTTGTASEAEPPNVPVDPAGESITTKEHTMPEIEEARLRQLEEDAGRVQTLESERDTHKTRADQAEESLAKEKAKTHAREYGVTRVREANSELDPATVDKIVAEAMREIPLTEADKPADQRLDVEAFGKQVDDARTAEETYLATVIKNRGGSVQGLGQQDSRPTVTEADLAAKQGRLFGRKGA